MSDSHYADLSDNGHSRGAEIVAIGTVFTTMAAILVSLRFFARFVIIRSPGWDDFLIFCSMVTSIALTALTAKQVRYGLGRHQASLAPEVALENLKALWQAIIVYYISLGFVKSSIIVQYLRIFVDKRMRTICWSLLVVVTLYSLTTVFLAAFTCYPFRFFWDVNAVGPHTCLDQKSLWFANASLNIVSDIVVLICPMPALSQLQLPKRQKIGVLVVFAIGGVTVIMSVLRLHSLYIISISTDVSWDNVGASTWSMVELNTGITCACLPMLKSLITRFFPRFLGSSRYTSGDAEPAGAYSRQRSKNNKDKSFCMTDGVNNEIRGAGAENEKSLGGYRNDIQVTTVVEVSRQGERYLSAKGGGYGSSANTSEQNLVLPMQKL
ncbi:hypothetical protein V495_02109 [Pseudogymnoascus sp. VKM F-4514 (FW-929)]|nr:hypothetical protein V495_02109 [Pseudogymnoascus sp. VKM F-4514 (FW-929)]KFY61557.1 hypothetical protein V497_02896 [Pseudogymnoascus sp. VKM F-4516 (FW-969)]